jgi:hypothetical protein
MKDSACHESHEAEATDAGSMTVLRKFRMVRKVLVVNVLPIPISDAKGLVVHNRFFKLKENTLIFGIINSLLELFTSKLFYRFDAIPFRYGIKMRAVFFNSSPDTH